MSMFKVGETVWVDFWRKNLKSPVIAEVRFDVKALHQIDIDEGSFGATALVYIRVPVESLYRELKRVPEPGEPHFVESGKLKIQEWSPFVEFVGSLTNKWHWVREDRDKHTITFVYEIEGTFPLGKYEKSNLYPFDFHELKIGLTSNWDRDMLIFIPWDMRDEYDPDLSLLEKSRPLIDPKLSRLRPTELEEQLKGRFSFAPYAMVNFHRTTGFHGAVYSNVEVSCFVDRLPWTHVFYEMTRPLVLSMIAPMSIIFLDNISSRLQYNTAIIVAMSVEFNKHGKSIINVADIYRIFCFAYAVIVLICSTFQFLFPGVNADEAAIKVAVWVSFLALNGVFIAHIMYNMFKKDGKLVIKAKYHTISNCIRDEQHVPVPEVQITPGVAEDDEEEDDDDDDDDQMKAK